jgi:hypothetical protein
VVVSRQVSLKPDDGTKIQVRSGLVEEEQVRLDEQRTGESDTHPPSTGHVLCRLGHHLLGETETRENGTCLGLKGSGVHLFELLVNGLERQLVDIIGDGKLLNEPLETSYLLLG